MQSLVIAASLEWVRTREKNVVTITPEAWKFVQAQKSSPGSRAAAQYIREGGVLNNWLWLDSQDLVGIDPEIRKQIGVWILGVQGEAIEAKNEQLINFLSKNASLKSRMCKASNADSFL